MAEKTSYIRIDRNIVRWRWWYDHNTLIVFLYLLLSANITEHGFSGITIHRGQLATSLQSLCNATGLTIRQIRTALQHLKSTGEVTSKAYSKFQVITIVNYDKYQDLTGKTPYKRQADDKQATSKRQQSENIENIENGEKKRRGRFAPDPPSGKNAAGISERDPEHDYPFKCGLHKKPEWMDTAEWERCKDWTVSNIPDQYRGQYDNVIEYLQDKARGRLK